jgi:hypothetical protein
MSRAPLLQTDENLKREDADGGDGIFQAATTAGAVTFFIEFNDMMFNTYFASWYYAHGLSSAELGFGFAMLSAGFAVTSLIFVKPLISKYGANVMQLCGAVSFIAMRVVIFFTPLVPPNFLFRWWWITCCMTGVCLAICELSTNTWVTGSVSADKAEEARGMCASLRMPAAILAPVVGGSLNSLDGVEVPLILLRINGFQLPLIFGAGLFAIFVYRKRKSILEYVPPPDRNDVPTSGLIVFCPPVALVLLCQFCVFSLFGSTFIWLQPLLRFGYKLETWAIGLTMCASCVWCAVAAFFVSERLLKKVGFVRLMIIAWSFIAFGLLWLGPCPFLSLVFPDPSPETCWVPMTGFGISTLGLGIAIPTFAKMASEYAVSHNWAQNDAAAQVASQSGMVCGSAAGVGPFIAGFLLWQSENARLAQLHDTFADAVGRANLCWVVLIFTVGMGPLFFLEQWDKRHNNSRFGADTREDEVLEVTTKLNGSHVGSSSA